MKKNLVPLIYLLLATPLCRAIESDSSTPDCWEEQCEDKEITKKKTRAEKTPTRQENRTSNEEPSHFFAEHYFSTHHITTPQPTRGRVNPYAHIYAQTELEKFALNLAINHSRKKTACTSSLDGKCYIIAKRSKLPWEEQKVAAATAIIQQIINDRKLKVGTPEYELCKASIQGQAQVIVDRIYVPARLVKQPHLDKKSKN